MANTANIQILRSYANSAPSSLLDGQLAYSFKSNTLFIGSNTGIISIGDPSTAAIAREAAANTVLIQGVDVSQNTRMSAIEAVNITQNTNTNIIQGGLNSANANISLIQGVDVSQNTRMSSIELVDVGQNTSITIIQGGLNSANDNIALTQAIDVYQNNNISIVQGGLNTANANISLIQGVDVYQNTRISAIETVDINQNTNIAIVQGGLNSANANIALIQGINLDQNTRLTNIESVDVGQNTNIAIVQGGLNSANANIALTQAVDVSQNTRLTNIETVDTNQNNSISIIQGGLNTANANISLLFAIDNAQNVNTTIVQGGLNTANANIALIFGIDTSQNTRMSAIETVDTNQNTAITLIQGVNVYQNTRYDAAFTKANSSLPLTGGTLTGSLIIGNGSDLTVTGNLWVTGNSFSANVGTLEVRDTVIILGVGNYTTDVLDIGFAGHYNDGANAHTGMFRDATTKEWYVFEGYTPEFTANNNIITSDPSFKTSILNANIVKANIISSTAIIGGADFTIVNNTQNTNIAIAQGGLNTANANISLIFGIDTSQNTRMTAIEAVDTTQNTRLTNIETVNTTQNNNITIVQGGLNSANANIALIQGVDLYQNTYAQSVNTYANAAFSKANTSIQTSGGSITGNLNITGNLIVNGSNTFLGNIANVHIVGGNTGQILTTDGVGNLNFIDLPTTNTITYTANTLTLTNGVYVSGSVTDTQVLNDGNYYQLTDGSGLAPAWIVTFGFTGVTKFNRIVSNIDYTLASGHIIYFQLYNYNTSFTLASGTVTTTTGTNIVTVSSTTGMSVGQTIKFGTSVGGLTSGTPYYILSIPTPGQLTVGTGTSSGSIVTLSNASVTSTVIIEVWDNFGSYSGANGFEQSAKEVLSYSAYINSGAVTARLYHSNQGNTGHTTKIDYFALEQSAQGAQGPKGATGATGDTGATGPIDPTAFDKANSANTLAQSAYNKANTALANTGSLITVNSASQLYISNTSSLALQVAGGLQVGAGSVSFPSLALGSSNRGFYNPTAGDIGFVSSGWEQVRYVYNGPTVNYLTFTGSGAGNTTIISTAGTDANIAISLLPKGNAAVMITGNTVGYIAAANSIYVGNRVGFANSNNISVMYQVYNPATSSFDIVLG